MPLLNKNLFLKLEYLLKYMLWYADFGWKHPHVQQTFLLSFPLRNLDVIYQDHLGLFYCSFQFFFTKLCGFLTTFAISYLDRVAKHRINCFADIFSSSKALKIWSKIPYMTFMGSSSNSIWWFLVFKEETVFLLWL